MHHNKRKPIRWFFLLAVVFLAWPLYGRLADRSRFVLQGVTAAKQQPSPTVQTVLRGDYQTKWETWYKSVLPGRTFLIRLRNQVLYSLLGTSSNENVVIGQNGQLYEQGYIDSYLGLNNDVSEADAAQIAANLQALQTLLAQNGKQLYVFITPNKARFVQDYPAYYNEVEKNTNSYELITAALQTTTVPVFDCVDYLTNYTAPGGTPVLEAPLFYKTGIHWDHCWGNLCAAALADQIRAETGLDLAQVSIGGEATTETISPNSDLYDLLNLLPRAHFTNYRPVRTVTPGTDAPRVLVRGSSFVDESLQMLFQEQVFSSGAILGNINCLQYENGEVTGTTQFAEYDELDLAALLANTDIVIYECNESVLYNIGWELTEYLLANPQLVQGGA